MRLSSQKLMINIIRAAPLTLSTEIASLTKKYSAASVACILRIVPTGRSQFIDDKNKAKNNSVLKFPSEVLNLVSRKDTRIEFLLIKRAVRNKDTWSGDTAFPGGFLEEAESDLAAIKRETMEEMGLDLDDLSRFQWLGRLQNTNFRDKTKVLIPHLFLYLGTDTTDSTFNQFTTGASASSSVDKTAGNKTTDSGVVGGPAMTLEPREVSAVRWIDVEELLRYSNPSLLGEHSLSLNLIDVFWPPKKKTKRLKKLAVMSYDDESDAVAKNGPEEEGKPMDVPVTVPLGRRLAHALASGIGCSTAYFPCFDFHPPRATANAHTDSDCGNAQSQPWVMWGMTFNITRSLLQVGNAGQPYVTPTAPFRVDNKLFNMYLRLWHRLIPYSGSHSASGKPLLTLSLICTLGTYTLPMVVAIDAYNYCTLL